MKNPQTEKTASATPEVYASQDVPGNFGFIGCDSDQYETREAAEAAARKTATAARNAVQLDKQGPYAWGVERDGKLIAQGLSKGAAEALAKTATACQKTPSEIIDRLNAKPDWAQAQTSPLPTLDWKSQVEHAISQGQSCNEFVMHCHPANREKARREYMRNKPLHRPIVALGRQNKDGTIDVTDVLTARFPDMTNEEMASLSMKLDEWSRTFRRTKIDVRDD